MQYIIPPVKLPFTDKASFDFAGGDLTSDGGLLMVGELGAAIGVKEILANALKPHPPRTYDDAVLTMQKAMLIAAGYHADDDATDLRRDPAFSHLFGNLASQETFSRRFSAMDASDAAGLRKAMCEMRNVVAASDTRDTVVIDVDTTLIAAFGEQVCRQRSHHYAASGFHPIIATDTLARDVVGFTLRPGAQYCSKGSGIFTGEVLETMGARHPKAHLFVRGDAGFAAPEVYEACGREGAGYAVRLKENVMLHKLSGALPSLLGPGVKGCVFGEFFYQAGPWDRVRRVVCRFEMAEGELHPKATFIVANLSAPPADIIAFYCQRGAMELIIGEIKSGFSCNCVQSRDMAANEFRCLVGILAYSLLNWLRRFALPKPFLKEKAATIRARFIKVAAKRVTHSRHTVFRFPSSYPLKDAVYRALDSIWRLGSA